MLKKAGYIALPLIVLAGMRRCPQMRINNPCSNCDAVADGLPGVIILASILVLAAITAVVLHKRQATLKA
jgi:multisubunit Na+/H+ antiporter MnhC subunit